MNGKMRVEVKKYYDRNNPFRMNQNLKSVWEEVMRLTNGMQRTALRAAADAG